jgi:hypothetical protein
MPASARAGIEVSTTYSFPTAQSNAIKMTIKAKNISGNKIFSFAMGQFYD